MSKMLVPILCMLQLVLSTSISPAAVVLEEDWNRGEIDSSVWILEGLSQGTIEIVERGGDQSLELSSDSGNFKTTIHTQRMLPRGGNLRCTFRVWHDGDLKNTGFNGPWHFTNNPLGLNEPGSQMIEAGIDSSLDANSDSGLQWFESGNCARVRTGPKLAKDFLKAFRSADSRKNSLLVRIELGERTGSRGFFSTDNGQSWTPICRADTSEPIDTRGMAAVDRTTDITVSSSKYVFVGFAPVEGKVFLDDILVESDNENIKAAPLPNPLPDAEKLIQREMFFPKGKRYEARVPDTLDLADRGALMVHGLTSFVNPAQGYCTFGQGYFNVNPAYMTQINGSEGHCCWSKTLESLHKARIMSGSEQNLGIEETMLKNHFGMPIVMNPTAHFPWLPRAAVTLCGLYQVHPTPEVEKLIRDWIELQEREVIEQDDYAFYDDSPPNMSESMLGVMGYWRQVFIHGTMLRELSTWHAISGDEEALALAGKLKNFLMQSRFWQAESGPKVVVSEDRAHFMGHHHSYTTALMGLLWYARQTGDTRLMEFCRSGYEYMRNFGLARIGLYAEMCTCGDMTQLALRLSEMGVGDYWNDADGYIRNQLVEMQVTDTDKLRRAVESMPENTRELDPVLETADHVVGRNLGCYLSDSSNPTIVREKTMVWTVCCNGNVGPALYHAWEAAIRCRDGDATVNLLLNRASPWLDVDSYLPYQGKVVIRNKTARRLAVRMPLWVALDDVQATIDGEAVGTRVVGRLVSFDKINPEDEITVTFPMALTTETYTLKWKETDFWYESTNPGTHWKADDQPTKFTMKFKGNTLVDISPRSKSAGYPLYQRDHILDNDEAPMKNSTRYVPARWPQTY